MSDVILPDCYQNQKKKIYGIFCVIVHPIQGLRGTKGRGILNDVHDMNITEVNFRRIW